MTKKTMLTQQKITEIVAYIKAGNFANVACRLAGVSERIYYHWLELGKTPGNGIYSEFYEAIEEAKAERESLLVSRLVESKNIGAYKFMLERTAPERWGKAAHATREPVKAEKLESTESPESTESLTPLERFKLCARALEQNDHVEFKRLYTSCPRYVYRMLDHEFQGIIDTVHRVSTAIQPRWAELLTDVRITEIAFGTMNIAINDVEIGYYKGYYKGYEAAGGVITYSDSDEEEEDEMTSSSDPLLSKMLEGLTQIQNRIVERYLSQVTELKAMWLALERLCMVCHISTEDLLVWAPYLREQVAASQVYLTSPNPYTILLLPTEVKEGRTSVDKKFLPIFEEAANKYYSEDEWKSKLENTADSYVAIFYALWKGEELADESSL
jgi:hypothetical protein